MEKICEGTIKVEYYKSNILGPQQNADWRYVKKKNKEIIEDYYIIRKEKE